MENITKLEARILQKKRISEMLIRDEKEKLIQERLISRLRSSKSVIGYRADALEVNLDSVWFSESLKHIDFYFPRVISMKEKKIEFIKPEHWEIGSYGLSEPIGENSILPDEVDFSIIPSLGFNRDGFRLGRGGGYYDRAFSQVNFKKMIGISFLEFFSIDFQPSDYDIRVGEILTDQSTLFFRQTRFNYR